jgi:ketosteroid isomerase-like protein
MNDIDKSIALVIETYKSAVLAKNVETFMHLYDPGVRVFDTWGVWSYEGTEAWRRAIEGWFTSLGADERVKVTFDDVRVSMGRDMSIVTACVTYAAVSAQGEPLRSMQNRLTWGLKTVGHVPRIVHEHTSVPVGFDDAKAILQRPTAS